MRRFSSQEGVEEENAIDLTPMLDVVFIMLIFFIVTSSFIRESGIEINRPNTQSAMTVKNGNILVAISANNEIWIDKRMVDINAVRANIARLYAEMPQGSVIVQADTNSNSGMLIKVVDQIKLAGIEKVSVAGKEE